MKTLKDLVKEYAMFDTYECCGIPDYLRSAAREWIKHLEDKYQDSLNSGKWTHEDLQYEDGAIHWIKHFFNLEDK